MNIYLHLILLHILLLHILHILPLPLLIPPFPHPLLLLHPHIRSRLQEPHFHFSD